MTPQQPSRDPFDVGPGGPVSRALARVVRLHRSVAGELLKNTGLYPGQEVLMMHLWAAGVVRQADLINALGLDPSTVTKMLQRLQRAGNVTRTTDPTDRRAVLVEATERSRALRPEIEAAQKTLEERTVAALDTAERAELHRLLEKVGANLGLQDGSCP
ncbi:MAG: MarR family transcriptional regulator, organic hydroperoxide resistance regulator [Mycobacterium sp.]|jgi:MarR family transcriptional regulator, organic hydroperoxide resistance regulator|nr:MarR family transcriptional regulator, organic hydroperoxide resistance regulator [Mycobacterium sp.]